MGAAWHLDYVRVTNTRSGEAAKFVYRNWFDSKAGWTHNLFPEGVVPDAVRSSNKKEGGLVVMHYGMKTTGVTSLTADSYIQQFEYQDIRINY